MQKKIKIKARFFFGRNFNFTHVFLFFVNFYEFIYYNWLLKIFLKTYIYITIHSRDKAKMNFKNQNSKIGRPKTQKIQTPLYSCHYINKSPYVIVINGNLLGTRCCVTIIPEQAYIF